MVTQNFRGCGVCPRRGWFLPCSLLLVAAAPLPSPVFSVFSSSWPFWRFVPPPSFSLEVFTPPPVPRFSLSLYAITYFSLFTPTSFFFFFFLSHLSYSYFYFLFQNSSTSQLTSTSPLIIPPPPYRFFSFVSSFILFSVIRFSGSLDFDLSRILKLSSICFEISLASNIISSSLICSGTTMIRTSRPA